MVGEVMAGLQGLNGLLSAAKALKDMNNETVRLQASIDFQRQLLAAIEDYQALAQEKRTLEAEVVRLRDWSAEKQRYELREHGENRALAYVLKATEGSTEPAHSLCPTCFTNGKKALLQVETYYDHGSVNMLVCQVSGTRLYTFGNAPRPSEKRR